VHSKLLELSVRPSRVVAIGGLVQIFESNPAKSKSSKNGKIIKRNSKSKSQPQEQAGAY
jgi:hypothetical protein